MRGGRRAHRRISAGTAQLCADGLRRRHTDGIAFVWNDFHTVECKDELQEGSAFLGADGVRLRDVAVHSGFVDLFRSVRTPGGAKSLCRGCRAVSARRADDGCAGGAAKPSKERPLAAANFRRLFFAAHVVALSLSFYRDPVAVRFAE